MEIYERDSWTNPGVNSIIGKEIYEYDIHSAGVNVLLYYGHLDKSLADDLLSMDKKDRVVRFGKYLRKHPELNKTLKEDFSNIRKLFFESNGLDLYDIVSIKKDAIFTTRRVQFTEFDNVKFNLKHNYSSYLKIPNLEFYYDCGNVTIKGVGDDAIPYYESTWIPFFKNVFYKAETRGKEEVIKYIRTYIDKYKKCELDIEFYRVLKPGYMFQLKNKEDDTVYLEFPKERFDELDISYNYTQILMKVGLIFV